MMPSFFHDYLERLDTYTSHMHDAIDELSQHALDWVPGQDMNSLCVLVVHTSAATRYWVGDVANADPSYRNRDAEFEAIGIPLQELKQTLDTSANYVRHTLNTLSLDDLDKTCTRPAYHNLSPQSSVTFTVGWALLHALEHLSLHVGHAQITRQLWDMQQASMG